MGQLGEGSLGRRVCRGGVESKEVGGGQRGRRGGASGLDDGAGLGMAGYWGG